MTLLPVHRHDSECPLIENFRDLDRYLVGALTRALSTPETPQEVLDRVRGVIAHLVDEEAREAVVVAQEDGVEARWREAGYVR